MRKYAEILAAACLAGYMAGALEVARLAPAAERAARARAAGVAFDLADPVFNPDAAADILLAKELMSKAEFDELRTGYRRYAFAMAGVDKENILAGVRDKLADAVSEGLGADAFLEKANAVFDAAGVTRRSPFHLQTVFETNVMSAYSAANWDMLHHPDVVDLFPLYRFDAVMDNRTSPICRYYNGVTLPADSPFWASHWPPLHHRCRSIVVALDYEVAQGVEETPPGPNAPPITGGFGGAGGAKGHWAVAEETLG